MSLSALERRILEYIAGYNHVGVPELEFVTREDPEVILAAITKLTRRKMLTRLPIGGRARASGFWGATPAGLDKIQVQGVSVRDSIIAALSAGPITVTDAAERCRVHPRTAQSHLARMLSEGMVTREPFGPFSYQYAMKGE